MALPGHSGTSDRFQYRWSFQKTTTVTVVFQNNISYRGDAAQARREYKDTREMALTGTPLDELLAVCEPGNQLGTSCVAQAGVLQQAKAAAQHVGRFVKKLQATYQLYA